MANDDKLKALDAAISHIEKQYGKGSIMKLGDTSNQMQVETVPTGSLSLDIALGQVVFQREESLRFTGQSPVVRRRWHYMQWQRYKKLEALLDLLMLNMP